MQLDRGGPRRRGSGTLAQALGVGPASLYTYVPGKAELLELMVDRVVGDQPLPAAGTAIEVASCVAAVESYTRGAASAVVEAEQAPEHTGSSDDEWREGRTPLLGERMEGRFPRLAALADAGAFAVSGTGLPYTLQRALDRFDFGLDLVLAAVGTRIAAARGATGEAVP